MSDDNRLKFGVFEGVLVMGPFDDGPGEVACLGCGEMIPDDDTGNDPYCGECWKLLDDQGFFEP